MKFNLRDLEYKDHGWTLYFKRVRVDAYLKFREAFCAFTDEAYNEDGSLNFEDMPQEQKQKLFDSGFEFLLANLIKAESNEGEKEEDREKLGVLLSFFWADSDFIEWRNGYVNGEKKT
jgi:hypothetical protein